MGFPAFPNMRPVTAFLIAALLLVACQAGGQTSPTSTATIAVALTGEPAPTEEGATAGGPATTPALEPAPSPTLQPAPSPTLEPAPSPTLAPGPTPAFEPAPTATPTIEPAPTATPAVPPTPGPVVPEANPKPFAMNLFRTGDFVAQYTFEWCVGASLQITLNMATDGSRKTRADQQDLWEMARDRSFSPFGGANPRGWTAVLNELGVGPYELVSLPTFREALNVAAEAMRATRRPVGLVMWRGRHAWVMSGFASTADPRRFDEFKVTGIRVLDPLYPHHNADWGRSPKPNSLLSPKTLAKQFVLRDSTRVNLGVPPGYLLVLPVAGDA